MDSKADLLMYGNGERAIIDVMHRLAKGEKIHEITDVRGTAFIINKHNKASKANLLKLPVMMWIRLVVLIQLLILMS
jgi:radical SAM superfamily enzyme YgiQ (UPF0313 family)